MSETEKYRFQAEIWFNESRDDKGRPAFARGYREEDASHLRRVYALTVTVVRDNEPTYEDLCQSACDKLFHWFNAPEDLLEPAERIIADNYRRQGLRDLSTGDVVRLGGPGGNWQSWAIASVGFQRVRDPRRTV